MSVLFVGVRRIDLSTSEFDRVYFSRAKLILLITCLYCTWWLHFTIILKHPIDITFRAVTALVARYYCNNTWLFYSGVYGYIQCLGLQVCTPWDYGHFYLTFYPHYYWIRYKLIIPYAKRWRKEFSQYVFHLKFDILTIKLLPIFGNRQLGKLHRL